MAGTALNIGSLSRYGGRIWSLSRRLTGAALPLDALAADILGAYSFRRLRTGYSGPAVRVRRDSDNTEQDFAFTAGNVIDTQALTTFCGAPQRPGDALSVSAAAAYSLRRWRAGYTGPAVRVRRSSDNAELDIGFFGDDLDTAALLAFVGAGDGFVTTWYLQAATGQVGSLTQTVASAQPRIVTSGVLETIGGKPAIASGGTGWMSASFTETAPPGITVCTAFQLTTTANGKLFDLRRTVDVTPLFDDAQTSGFNVRTRNNASVIVDVGAGVRDTIPHSGTYGWDGANIQRWMDGTASATAASSGARNLNILALFTVGTILGTAIPNAKMSELVVFFAALPGADRQMLERSQCAYHGINYATGIANGFVTTQYDQSLTPRNVTQATASAQPTIVSAGVLQLMNARPVMRWPDAQNSVALAYLGTGSPGTHIVVGQYSGPNPFDVTRAAFTFQDADGTNAGLSFLGTAGGTIFSRPVHLNGATVASTTALPTVQSPFIGRNSVAPTPNRNQWWIGGDRGIANRGWRGPIAETLIFSRTLSASEIAALQSNLSAFYGIPLV